MSGRHVVVTALTLALLGGALAPAQDKPEDKAGKPVPRTFQARLTANRQVAGKNVESIPYEFVVREGQESWIRSGTEVPIPVTTFTAVGGEKASIFSPATSYQYKNVGISITCSMMESWRVGLPGNLMQVRLNMEHSVRSGSKPDPDGRSLPQFDTNHIRIELIAKPGEVYHVATTRHPGSDETLQWDFVLQPLR